MTNRSIWIEWRGPLTKSEKKLWGQTVSTNKANCRIFINTKKNRSIDEEVKTYWHEMTHAFMHFYKCKRMNAKKEEELCRRVEHVVWEMLR